MSLSISGGSGGGFSGGSVSSGGMGSGEGTSVSSGCIGAGGQSNTMGFNNRRVPRLNGMEAGMG